MAAGAARSQQFSGVLESYFRMNAPVKGVFFDSAWLEARYRLSDSWKLVSTHLLDGPDYYFEANYAEYDQPNIVARMGKLRSTFGFAQWSDTHFNVAFHDPIIRSDGLPLAGNVGLNRLDIGAEFQYSRGPYQLTVDALDVATADQQVFPQNIDHVQARLQGQFGNVILGVNGLARHANPRDSAGSIVSGDLRWTAPRIILRGELVRGDSPGYHTDGYYADLTYRPPWKTRTELGVRNEGFSIRGSGDRANITTAGIRQMIGKSITLNLNYGWGRAFGDDQSALKGWTAQFAYRIQF